MHAPKDTDWRRWTPGLDNDDHDLGEVYRSLPGDDPGAIHLYVRLFENPDSPVAFPGAVSLERHDCIHILLGRGLLAQDEAFVIGYTMGTCRAIRSWQVWSFKQLARRLYPGIYRMRGADVIAFDLGFNLGQGSMHRDLAEFPFEEHMETDLGELRRMLDIHHDQLRAAYRTERLLHPDTEESRRLPLLPCDHAERSPMRRSIAG